MQAPAPAMIEVPVMLTSPVREPDLSAITTNGDMLDALIDYQASLRICNAKLQSIGTAYGQRVE